MSPPGEIYFATSGENYFGVDSHATSDDTMYFTGAHRADQVCESTGQRLTLRGFSHAYNRIVDVNGGIELRAPDGTVSAAWTFSKLLQHWGRKHAAAAYVPYEKQESPRAYRYTSPAWLGEGTSFEKFLTALAAREVVYDPGPKVTGVKSGKPKTKARSQFRIRKASLKLLYERFVAEALG